MKRASYERVATSDRIAVVDQFVSGAAQKKADMIKSEAPSDPTLYTPSGKEIIPAAAIKIL